MVNYSKKIAQALTIIRKFYTAVNIERTDNEDVVYLFDYTENKKTIGSDKISKAFEKAIKQQDFPKDVFYSNGLLSIIKIEENVQQLEQAETIETDETDETDETEEITETVQPKKRGRKKQTDAES
jgi:hypothetical protein